MKVMKFIVILLAFFAVSCAPQKKRPQRPDVSQYKPTLDDFFENIPLVTQTDEQTMPTASKRPLKIAVVLPVSGVYSKLGGEVYDAILLAQSKVEGSKLEISVFDTRSTPSAIPEIAREIREGGYNVVLGPIFSAETSALVRHLGGADISVISLSNDRNIAGDNVIVFGYSSDDSINDTVTFFAQNRKKNFVAIFPGDAQGTGLYKTFKNAAAVNRADIMRVEFYDKNGIAEVSRYVSKALNGLVETQYIGASGEVLSEHKIRELSRNPAFNPNSFEKRERVADILYISATGATLRKILDELKRPEYSGKLKDTLIVLADSAEGEVIGKQEDFNGLFFYSGAFSAFANFTREFRADYGYKPSKLSAISYDAFSFILFANNRIRGELTVNDLEAAAFDFYGVNGAFEVVSRGSTNYARRRGRIMVVKSGVVREVELFYTSGESIERVLKRLESGSGPAYGGKEDDFD